MKLSKKVQGLAVGFALIFGAEPSSALTLGKARGAVLLGQPLSLDVVLQFDGKDDSADWCFDAEVYYGDVRQEGGRVTVMPFRSDLGVLNSVRIISSLPVDEPVVTVYLRTSCGIKTSRKYVLLSDLASELVTPPAAISAPSGAAQPVIRSPSAGSKSETAPQKNEYVPSKLQNTFVKSKKAVTTAGNNMQSAPVVQRPPGPRLKVSMLDLFEVRDPSLRMSSELITAPTDDNPKRAAAQVLWRSLNTSIDDVLRDDAQQLAITSDLKALKDITAKNQQELQEMSARLAKAESERFANPLIFLLAGLLIVALLALTKLAFRMRSINSGDTPWWSGGGVADDDEYESINSNANLHSESKSHPVNAGTKVDVSAISSTGTTNPGAEESNDVALDIDLDLSNPLPSNVETSAPQTANAKSVIVQAATSVPPVYQRDFSHSLNATLHAINTQEMLDVRQQADFFMTLGQHDEAIGLLETSILESDSSNPLVYIDLLKVLHTLSRKPAFDHYRNEFNSIFTGWVPQYSVFGQPGNSLDAYPQICAEISQVWGSESALEFLEECMVRSPEDGPEHYFDLDAFRDLLMLHAIAGRIGENAITDSRLMPFSAIRTAVTPAAKTIEAEGQPTLDELQAARPLDSKSSLMVAPKEIDDNLIDFDASGLSVSPLVQNNNK